MASRSLVILTERELRDALRNRWFIADAIALATLSTVLAFLTTLTSTETRGASFGRTAASLINLMLLLVPLMGLTLGAVSLAGDRERGVLEFWLTQPVTTATVFIAKALGTGLALTAAICVGFGTSGIILFLTGAGQPSAFLFLAGLTILLAWTALALGLVVASPVSRTSTALSFTVALWLLLVLLSYLGLLGTALVFRLPPQWLLGLALLNPIEAYRLAALHVFSGTLELLGPAGQYADDLFGAALPAVFATMLLWWGILSTLVAFVVFRREALR